MPIHFRTDQKPVIEFAPGLEISPFVLFRRLREGNAPRLVDIRRQPGETTLEGACHRPDPDWEPEVDSEIVLFDDDGVESVARARALQERGHETVKALFGGLELYGFSLDPEVVGSETFLIPVESTDADATDDGHHR